MAYYGEHVTLLLSLISMLMIAYCVIIIPLIVLEAGRDYLLGVALSASAIVLGLAVERLWSGFTGRNQRGSSKTLTAAIVALFAVLIFSVYAANAMELSFVEKLSVITIDLASYSIPVPNTPFFVTFESQVPSAT